MDALIANITKHRNAQGKSIRMLQTEAGLGKTGLYDILNRKSRYPTIESVAKIADALGVRVYDLFLDPESDGQLALLRMFDALPPEEQRRILLLARALLPTDATQNDKSPSATG